MISLNPRKHRLPFLIASVSLLIGCSQPGSPDPDTSSAPAAGATLDAAGPRLTVPKVPFGNQPCRSLSPTEQQTLEQKAWGYARPVPGKADRAPAGLPSDNLCFYYDFNVGYMTQGDYQTNRDGNHSTEHADPAGLPGAFYDKQGGLWFAKNGYYVVIAGSRKLEEAAAQVIAAKL